MAINALVGGMLGQERTVVPLLGERTFHVGAYAAGLSFIAVFGLAKAATNFLAGSWADRFGRRPVLLAGWLVAVPVPLLLIWAPSWAWVVVANVLLGASQGLTWSTTVIMKIDLVGPARRGLAMGLNEAAGYAAVGGTALVTGYLAQSHGLRPAPFLLGLAYAALGLLLTTVWTRETLEHARLEQGQHVASAGPRLSDREVFVRTSFRDRTLAAVSQAGLVNNLNDGLAWGLFPGLFAAGGMGDGRVGVLVAVYPLVWGAGQLVTGHWSDRVGRRPLVVAGMLLQAGALVGIALGHGFALWLGASALLGAGTALVYPTLLAAIGDVAPPAWRARAVGTYRLWRDGGFVVGALLAGTLADLFGVPTACWLLPDSPPSPDSWPGRGCSRRQVVCIPPSEPSVAAHRHAAGVRLLRPRGQPATAGSDLGGARRRPVRHPLAPLLEGLPRTGRPCPARGRSHPARRGRLPPGDPRGARAVRSRGGRAGQQRR